MRATSQEKAKLEQIVQELGFRSVAHFFTRSMETLVKQHDKGCEFVWPLKFQVRAGKDTLTPEE